MTVMTTGTTEDGRRGTGQVKGESVRGKKCTCLHYCWHGVYVLFRADDDIDRVELDCRNVMETHALLCKLTNRSISKIHRGMKDE